MSKKDLNKKVGGEKEKLEKDKRSKTLQMFSVASVIILIVIVLFVNIIFDMIIGDKLTFDFSATGQNSISQVTEDYLNSLSADTNVRIIGLMDRPVNLKDSPYEYIVPLLDDYQAKSNGKITVEYINPETYPSIIKELDPESVYDLSANTFVVSSNNKISIINPIDCFTYNQDALQYAGQYIPTANIVESTFTNAIVNLTKGYSNKAYFVTGLNNSDEHKMLSNILSGLGVESEDLMASDSFVVPADCNLLVISGINIDITESMQVAILDYLNEGGYLIVAVDYMQENSNEAFPRLNAVLDFMGLAIDPKVIYEADPNFIIPDQGNVKDPGFNSYGSILNNFTDLSDFNYIMSSYSRPVKLNQMHSYQLVAGVLGTSDIAETRFVENGTWNVQNNQSDYYIGAYATYDGMTNPPKAYVFGTTTLTSDNFLSTFGFNSPNGIFIKGVIRDLLSADDSLYVEAKPLANYSIDTTKVTSSSVTTMTFVLMVIIPLAFVITGTIVYRKRKNL